ncbi:MAG TPA: hypothetical protein VG028_20780 [Terriglobia bacterium]|nr:hypothetical protein [Terriglobia bacterium]
MSAAVEAATDIRQQFEQAGFEIAASGGDPNSFEVRKNNCSRTLARDSKGGWCPAGPPHFFVRGMECRLEDHGYQKFWLFEGKRFPIRQGDLKSLHQFDEEVRAILVVKSLYHESLGTTSARSVYDRLEGRPDHET